MFIPLISVTAIGLITAATRNHGRAAFGPVAGAGLAGAWLGYLLGLIVGGVADVFLFGGFWPVLVGHLAAVAVSRVTVTNRARAAIGPHATSRRR